MKSFQYTIHDELGIHARPAGILVKAAKQFKSAQKLEKGGKAVDLTRLMALMSLGVKCGDEITVTADGEDEEDAITALEKIVKDNL